MSILNKARNRRQKPAEEPAPTLKGATADVVIADEGPAAVEEMERLAEDVPPWTNPKCRACGGTGINSKRKDACGACAKWQERNNGPVPDDFETGFTDSGKFYWKDKAGSEGSVQAVTETKAKKQTSRPKAEPKPIPVPEPLTEKERIDRTVKEADVALKNPHPDLKINPTMDTETEAPKTVSVPAVEVVSVSATSTLFIGCAPITGAAEDLNTILHEVGNDLARENGCQSFYELQPFDRRDELAKLAPEIVKSLAGKDIVCIGGSPDLDHFRNAIMAAVQAAGGKVVAAL